jgi:DNA gyrase subunit B
MSKDYSSKDIQVLDGLTHVQLNPNMYISTTENPCHLIEEALDNALDEGIAGYADIIAVMIDTKTGECRIMDNGRGIPIDNDVAITISTELFSGAKFQDRKNAYNVSSGLHGVGMVAVYALSEKYKIEIYKDDTYVKYEKKKKKFKKVLSKEYTDKKPFSTSIEFKASDEYFDSIIPDINRIRRRMTIASVELPHVRFILQIDGVTEVIHYSLDDYFNKECLNNYVNGNYSERIEIEAIKGDERLFVSFCYEYDASNTPKYSSAVNILPVKNGGNHINFINDIIKKYLLQKAKKNGYNFNPQDIVVGLRSYMSLSLINPKLKGQSKESLENTKDQLSHLLDEFQTKLISYLNTKPDLVDEILSHLHEYRKKINMKKLKTSNSNKGRGLKKFTKLRDCQLRHGELFIVEGDSAAGGIIQARDPKKIAVLPLKGKIASVTNKKNILENKEIGEMISAFGTGIEPDFNINNFRYDKIICCCDADADGGHIATLLTMNIALLAPELIKQGHYYIAYTPLYAINEKKTFIPLWTSDELNKAIKANRKITRYKGLGELNISDLKTCLLNEQTRKIVQVQWNEELQKLVGLMNNVSDKRLLLKGEF